MPYGNDPASNPLDQVRFLLGDTDVAHPELTDPEVAFLLSDAKGDTRAAAARGAETLASRYSTDVSEKQVGPLRIVTAGRGLSRSERYLQLAKYLWSQATAVTAGPWAGGINVTDKATRAADTEVVQPAFTRDLMEYPVNSATTLTEDERVR